MYIKAIFFTVLNFIVIQTILANPVIIKDTGKWKGYIHAENIGFTDWKGYEFTQGGTNSKSATTWFTSNFTPDITNCGFNYVSCKYSGNVEGLPTANISFEVQKIIIRQVGDPVKTINSVVNEAVIPLKDQLGNYSVGWISNSKDLYESNLGTVTQYRPTGEYATAASFSLETMDFLESLGDGVKKIGVANFIADATVISAGLLAWDLISVFIGDDFVPRKLKLQSVEYGGADFKIANPYQSDKLYKLVYSWKNHVTEFQLEVYDDSNQDGFVPSSSYKAITPVQYINGVECTAKLIWNKIQG